MRLAGGARLQADLTLTATPSPHQVRQEARTVNVTLGSIAMNEVHLTQTPSLTLTLPPNLTRTRTLTYNPNPNQLECPRLVFISPYTPVPL